MNNKIALASILLNVILALSLLLVSVTDKQSGVPMLIAKQSACHQMELSDDLAGASYLSIEDKTARGLSESQFKMLRLQELKQKHLNTIPVPADYYWTSAASTGRAEYLLMQLEGHRKIREDLMAEFGHQARSAPELSEVFRPLAAQHDYLPSQQQIALREFQIETQAEFMRQPPSVALGSSMQMGVAASPLIKNRSLEDILSADMLFEYNLRTSPLATRMRSSELGLTEQQFRDVFSIYNDTTSNGFTASPDQHKARMSALRSLMGRDLAVKVTASLDPTFAAIKLAVANKNVSDRELYSTYEILLDTDREIVEAYTAREQDPVGSNLGIYAALKSREERLHAVLGAEMAADILDARQEFSKHSNRRSVSIVNN